jgi:hypothetical protein
MYYEIPGHGSPLALFHGAMGTIDSCFADLLPALAAARQVVAIVRPEHTMKMFRLLGGGVIGDLAGLPASQLAVLPGTSHVGLLDRVDWLQSMILEFLGSLEPRSR